MRRMAPWVIAVFVIAMLWGTAASAGAAIKIRPVATGLNGPSGFTFAPNGTIWYLERGTGEVRTLDPATGNRHLVFTIGGVDGSGERGALGIALHPRWPKKQVVFAYVTRMGGGQLQNQLVRFTVNNGTGSGLRVLLRTPASSSPYHNGGRILFGPGNKLFVVIGEAPAMAARLIRWTLTARRRRAIPSDGSGPTGTGTPSGSRSIHGPDVCGRPRTGRSAPTRST